ncbi:MAG: GlxA family transcriptional regulator [Candidatus Sulfotelmatobacter sp.]
MRPKHIVIVGYDDLTSLDLSGPLEAFNSASLADSNGNPQPCYKVTIAALGAKTFSSVSGLHMTATCFLSSLRHMDTLVIPGGRGIRLSSSAPKLADWISRRANGIRRIASVCTGAFAIAPTGLLDGRRVTTHWKFAAELAGRFPALKVDANALYIRDGKFYTSAGVTAGIDLSLALIEEDFGPHVALAVARELVVYMKRPGGQEQFSEPLKFQVASTSRFADLAAWMPGHLNKDLSVEAMAERMNLCPRQFSRRFRLEFNSSPAAFVQRLRLDEARKRLSAGGCTVMRVAESVGFHDPDSFRRAFMQRFGVAPTHYRSRFVAGAGN